MHEPAGTQEILEVLDGDAIPADGLSAGALQQAGNWQGKSQLYKALNWLVKRGYVEKIEEGRWPSYRITVPGSESLTSQGCDLP
jgi:Fe2+ or Zn2+ uptake regulation protein